MIFITGDTHGDPARIWEIRRHLRGQLHRSNILIVLGDFGFIFHGHARENTYLDELSRMHLQVLFVDGNHENFPLIHQYPVETWQGGKTHRIRNNIRHLQRGQVFELAGQTFFTMGGGYSIDKSARVNGISWWREEMPSEAEYSEARVNLQRHHFAVDYVLTHAAPEDTMSMFHHHHPEEQPLNNFLEWVRESTTYKRWLFGHLHMDEDLWRRQTCVYRKVHVIE